MPSAAAEPSLTSSSSGASGSGQPAGHDDRIARPRGDGCPVDLDHRRRPATARRRSSATSIIVHDARAAWTHTRPSSGSAPSRTTGRRRCTRRGRPATPARRPPGRSRSARPADRSRSTNWSMASDGAATGCPGRHRHGGGETGEHAEDAAWRPGAGARARPSASVPPRSPSAPVCRLAPSERPAWWHIVGGVGSATPRRDRVTPFPTAVRPACMVPCGRSRCSWPTTARSSARACGRCCGATRDVEVVGVAEDYDTLVAGAAELHPDVVVSDIRMPPHFQREGIDAAKEIRKIHPGTGIVILSQYDDPDYAVSLLSEGSAGYAYLLKDRIAEGDQLGRAIREVATGGSMLDPVIVTALMSPVRRTGGLERRGRRAARPGRRRTDDEGHRRARRRRRRPPSRPRSSACSSSWRRRCRRARRAPSTGCAGCTRRSSSARSRARRSAGCCRPASPTSCSPRAAASARPSGSRSPC